jgi:hypothetical protein
MSHPNLPSLPSNVEIINNVKDIHMPGSGRMLCIECCKPWPCQTFAYVDGLLAARGKDPR